MSSIDINDINCQLAGRGCNRLSAEQPASWCTHDMSSLMVVSFRLPRARCHQPSCLPAGNGGKDEEQDDCDRLTNDRYIVPYLTVLS